MVVFIKICEWLYLSRDVISCVFFAKCDRVFIKRYVGSCICVLDVNSSLVSLYLQAQSRFGASVAVLDINLDGADDIAIGAPAYTELFDSPLQYSVSVYSHFPGFLKCL